MNILPHRLSRIIWQNSGRKVHLLFHMYALTTYVYDVQSVPLSSL